MGIKFNCPNGHKLNVKSFLAGRRGICPHCDARFRIPMESGGEVELVLKSDRGGEATQLTDAMQDEVSASDAVGSYPQVTNYEESFGSPLGTAINVRPWATSPANTTPVSNAPQTGTPAIASPVASYTGKSADLLDEDPQAVWYVRPHSGGQYGPAVGEIMRDWIREGRVAGDSYVWREGWTDWRSASSVFPQLAGLLSSGAAPTVGPVGAGLPIAASQPVGGIFPAANIAAAGAFPVAGPVASGGGVPVLGALPASGMAGLEGASAAPLSSSVKKKIDPRRRNSDFTALIVMLLVIVALVLVGVFAWVLFGQKEEPTAYLTPAFSEQASPAETLPFSA